MRQFLRTISNRPMLAGGLTTRAGSRLFLVSLVLGVSAFAAGSKTYADYPPSVEEASRLVALLQDSVAVDPPQGDIFALAEAEDATAPVPAISSVIILIQGLLQDEGHPLRSQVRSHLAGARDAAQLGLERYGAGDPAGTVRALGKAVQRLQAVAPSPQDPQHDTVGQLSIRLVFVAKRIAGHLLQALARGSGPLLGEARVRQSLGDLLSQNGEYVAAVVQYGGATDIASRGIGFHIDLFEQNIRDALDRQTIGYAYTIGRGGQLYSQDGIGDARSEKETTNPGLDQSPVKEMYIASMSKTISALALFVALREKGISVDEGIAKYLPERWAKGPGVNENDDIVTFRHLLTHTSGLSETGQLFDELKEAIRMGTPGLLSGPADPTDLGHSCLAKYTNTNYGLLRILIPQIVLGQAEIDSYSELPTDDLYAMLYSQYVVNRVLQPARISVSGCSPREGSGSRTLYYSLFSPGSKGLNLGNWSRKCGATGWYLSSNELGSLLAYVRYTDMIIDDQIRDLMDEGYLGWLNPCKYSDLVNGDHGTYRAHGGDSTGTGPGMYGCMMNFRAFDLPIQVEATVLINSRDGDLNGDGLVDDSDHPCSVLKVAFDQAWY